MSTQSLANEPYVNIESFKKDGGGVKTPVWVAGLDGKLVIVTDGTSYKVKRIRRNPKVRVAPCDARGGVAPGAMWEDGECRVIEDPARAERAEAALKAKYGFQYRALNFFSRISFRFGRRAYLEISIG